MSHYEGDLRTPESARFAILASRWNARITDTLVAGARQSLAGNGIAEANIDVIRVPGAWSCRWWPRAWPPPMNTPPSSPWAA